MTVTQRLFNPLFLCFSPFFRQFVAALSGFLAPRRRKRAQHGENERNLGEERPRQRVDKVWRWAQTTATTRWRGMIPTMRRRAPGWRCTLALTKPTLFHSAAWINSKELRQIDSEPATPRTEPFQTGIFPAADIQTRLFGAGSRQKLGTRRQGSRCAKPIITPVLNDFSRFFPVPPWSYGRAPWIPDVQTLKMGENGGKWVNNG